jgi:hypothetical protein
MAKMTEDEPPDDEWRFNICFGSESVQFKDGDDATCTIDILLTNLGRSQAVNHEFLRTNKPHIPS